MENFASMFHKAVLCPLWRFKKIKTCYGLLTFCVYEVEILIFLTDLEVFWSQIESGAFG